MARALAVALILCCAAAQVIERSRAAMAQLSRDAQWLAGNEKLGTRPGLRQ